MGEFEVGDRVQMPNVPVTVTVLEIADRDGERCFRFADPGGLGDDWMPVDQFRKVSR